MVGKLSIDPLWNGRIGTLVFQKTNGRIRRQNGRIEVLADAQRVLVHDLVNGRFRTVPFEFILDIVWEHSVEQRVD
jgi:hypothetical protein